MRPRYTLPMLLATAALLSACASQKTPATADVAVTRAAVENATQAGAADLAPAELLSAREKLQQASRALADKDYKLASDLSQQAQADAKLAQSKATSAKATGAANEVQENVRVLREELDRANKK
jgi:Skp family chaperone for outer membrane proteins